MKKRNERVEKDKKGISPRSIMELSSEDYVVHFPGGFDVKGI